MSGCHYCGTTERDLRPYGPGGSALCVPCMDESPERKEIAKRAFAAQLSAAAVIGDGVAVLTEDGPNPYSGQRSQNEAACAICGGFDNVAAEESQCSASQRDGDHCGHAWTHDVCHWCGVEWGGDGAYTCPACGEHGERP